VSLILNIETSTTVCSVALAEDEKLLAIKEENKGYTHAEKITLFIQEVLSQSGKKVSDLNAVAVSNGPGSYTGLRIGASTAKGLCYALNIPLIGVDTLKALAVKCGDSITVTKSDLLCPMIDARRMEVYCALFDSAFNNIQPVSARIIDENSFADFLAQQKVYFFGDGASKCKALLAHQKNAVFIDGLGPSAATMISLSHQKFLNKEFEDTSLYEPFYLKEVVAKKST
jgi:tRNA threonylcarbamoyladenosine biosynthesis protein TsaB